MKPLPSLCATLASYSLCLILLLLPVSGQQPNAPTLTTSQQPAAEPQPQPEMPVTTRFPDEAGAAEIDALLKPPPLPKKEKVTLIGGTVGKIDRIRNRVAVNVFGGKRMNFEFDERTRIFRDGTEVTSMGIKDRDRIYIDSQLDENRKTFARNIHIVTNLVPAEASGQILSFNARNGRMSVHDQLSSRPITFIINQETRITDSRGAAPADSRQLQPGTLVEVGFAPARGARGRRAVAEQVKLIATINSEHIFEGPITHLDLRGGILAIRNQRDNRTYDLTYDPRVLGDEQPVSIGRVATARARYTGQGYQVQQLRLHEEAKADTDEEGPSDDQEEKQEKDDEEDD